MRGRRLCQFSIGTAAGLLIEAVLASSCAQSEPGLATSERCLFRVWYQPAQVLSRKDLKVTPDEARRPELIGSWDDFRRPGQRVFEPRQGADGSEWWTLSLPLSPGSYRYGLIVGDHLLLDPQRPQSAFGPDPRYLDSRPYEAEFSLAEIPDCAAPRLLVESAESTPLPVAETGDRGAVRFRLRFHPGSSGARLDETQLRAELRSGDTRLTPPMLLVEPPGLEGEQAITAHAERLGRGKHTLTVSLDGPLAALLSPVKSSVFVESRPDLAAPDPEQRRWEVPPALDDGLVYQVFVDRFRGSQGALAPPRAPGLRAGGTLDGVREAVAAGYFERLGVTTLWLSPLYQNPPGQYVGRDGNTYEAYHGYWPAAPRGIEAQFGGEVALDALVAAAHRRGLRVIFDAVPNHVYEGHPYYQGQSRRLPEIAAAKNVDEKSWFNDGLRACICGRPGCGWGERIEDCWFDRYLPDLNWRHPAVMAAGTADLLWWLERHDLDGMRIDAVPMMPRAATRRIGRAVRDQVARFGLDELILGEDYTGPGDFGRSEIRSFLGPRFDGLDSAFDFPLMWAIRDALAGDRLGLDGLEVEIVKSRATSAHSGAVLAHILDNHDTPRFLSEAAGNAGNDPWLSPPPQPTDEAPYLRQRLGLTLLLTLPGLPVLYYGDEVGLAGANDPDSRRPLPEVLGGALPARMATTLRLTATLGRLRRCLPALRRGERRSLLAEPELSVALHSDAATAPHQRGQALVVLSRATSDRWLSVSGLVPGRYRDVLSGEELVASEERAAVLARKERPAVYVSVESPCLTVAAGMEPPPLPALRSPTASPRKITASGR